VDFDSIDMVDLKLFDEQINQLLEGKEVIVPTYNFIIGTKEFEKAMKLDDNDILIIEGIHALNPDLLTNISDDKKYKLYVSALTLINLDDYNRVSSSDNRLLRRIVRDNMTRGRTVEETLEFWSKVRRGEENYIFPYQEEADRVMNTAYVYELGVLKTYVEPLLYAVPTTSKHYEEARRLLNTLRLFLPIPSEDIPDDSVLREFVGRSYFNKKGI
jgi:uridine kinase